MDPRAFTVKYLGPEMRHSCLYHFTDHKNLISIKKLGLLSMRLLRQQNVAVVPGGNRWSLDADLQFGMDAYVHLCFSDDHPMEYRAKNADARYFKFLHVDPAVMQLPGVLFSDDVSNKRGVKRYPIQSGLDIVDTEVLYERTDWKNPAIKERLLKARKCEVLVPTRVPLHLVSGF